MASTPKRSAKSSVVPAAEAFFKAGKKPRKEDLVEVRRVAFPELEGTESGEGIEKESFGTIPVPVTVELGRAEMSLKEVLDLARKLHPEVILMDINMPKVDGIEATRVISAELPGTRIIGLSMYEDEGIRSSMLAAGAVAYVKKDSVSEMLLAAIRDRRAAK